MKNKIIGIFFSMMLLAMSMVTALESDNNLDEKVNMNKNIQIKENNEMKLLDLFSEEESTIKDIEKDFDSKKSFKDLLEEKIDLISCNDGFNFKESKHSPTNERFSMQSSNICFLSGNYNIQGFVKDKSTSSPIDNAQVIVQWPGNRQSYERDVTFSDSDGYYKVDFELNEVLRNALIIIRCNQYYSEVMSIYEDLIEDNDIWFNASLEQGGTVENSVISGYVNDLETGESIPYA
jgi:hypothetical protein